MGRETTRNLISLSQPTGVLLASVLPLDRLDRR
jgi:hypothetical protein